MCTSPLSEMQSDQKHWDFPLWHAISMSSMTLKKSGSPCSDRCPDPAVLGTKYVMGSRVSIAFFMPLSIPFYSLHLIAFLPSASPNWILGMSCDTSAKFLGEDCRYTLCCYTLEQYWSN